MTEGNAIGAFFSVFTITVFFSTFTTGFLAGLDFGGLGAGGDVVFFSNGDTGDASTNFCRPEDSFTGLGSALAAGLVDFLTGFSDFLTGFSAGGEGFVDVTAGLDTSGAGPKADFKVFFESWTPDCKPDHTISE